MFLVGPGWVHDYDLELLQEVSALLDRQIAKLEVEIDDEEMAEQLGYGDRVESVIGLGFVACQQYINATYPQLARPGQKRRGTLLCPPLHSGGCTIAEIVDAAANYWKHNAEWPHSKRPELEKETRRVLDSIVVVSDGYPLEGVLRELVSPQPPRFGSVLQLLVQWRDGLI